VRQRNISARFRHDSSLQRPVPPVVQKNGQPGQKGKMEKCSTLI